MRQVHEKLNGVAKLSGVLYEVGSSRLRYLSSNISISTASGIMVEFCGKQMAELLMLMYGLKVCRLPLELLG